MNAHRGVEMGLGRPGLHGDGQALDQLGRVVSHHVDADHFLDYLSRRSPVFKQRPLPTSKREAITLMLEQPNLIKRPILITGDRAIFGFDRAAYDRMQNAG